MRSSFEGINTDIAVGHIRADIPLAIGNGNPGIQVIQSPDVKGMPDTDIRSPAGLVLSHMRIKSYDSAVKTQYRAATQEEYAQQGISERVITTPLFRSMGTETTKSYRKVEKRGLFGKSRTIVESYLDEVNLPNEAVRINSISGSSNDAPGFLVGYSLMSRSLLLRDLYVDGAGRPGIGYDIGVVLPEEEAIELTHILMEEPNKARSFAQYVMSESIGVPNGTVPIPNFVAFGEKAPYIQFAEASSTDPTEGTIISTT